MRRIGRGYRRWPMIGCTGACPRRGSPRAYTHYRDRRPRSRHRRPDPRSEETGIRHNDREQPADRGPRLNEQIRISPIRLIGPEGEQLGVVMTSLALERAREAGMDLVEVAADERPPVCKILDYGKMRFASSQKGNKAGRVRQQKLKEIRVRPKTGDHDIDTKVAKAREFLGDNDKVQVTVTFRGREMQHVEEGRRVLDSVLEKLAEVGKVERPPTMDGKKMTAMLMPIKGAAKPKPKPELAKPTG
jgi:translation initiation factor IF-3